MEVNKEHVIDSALIGNFNVLFPPLAYSIRNHPELTVKEKKRLNKLLKKIQASLLAKTCFRTFKEEHYI